MDPRREGRLGRRRIALAVALLAWLPGCAPRLPLEPAAPGSERLVIDVRQPEAFARGHHPGALNLQRGWSQLADRSAAYVPDPATPIAIRGADEADAERAAATLAGLGYRDLALAPAGGETATLDVATAAELRARLAEPDPPLVIDVRTEREFATGAIPGALLVDQDAAPGIVDELDPERAIAVICEKGYRSSQLASLLRRRGFERVTNVVDGMRAWRKLER